MPGSDDLMPTLTKLLALLLFAGFAAAAAERYVALYDDPPGHGSLVPYLAALGAAVGWRYIGVRVGGGVARAAWVGVQAVLLLVFWALAILGTAEVFARGYARHYDGVTEALIGWFDIALEHLARMAEPDFVLFLIGGGVVVGVVCSIFDRFAERRRRG